MSISLNEFVIPFRIARFRVRLRPERELTLPRQQGSSLRGALAMSLKNVVCSRRDLETCSPCPHREECTYPYLFETEAPETAPGTRGFESFPRPYVISYPAIAPTLPPRPGASDHEIGLTLVGNAIPTFPYLALALRDLESRGLGRGRGRFELSRVDALSADGSPTVVYEGGVLYGGDHSIMGEDLLRRLTDHGLLSQDSPSSVRLRFLSPTSLIYDKRPARLPEFHILVRNLLRRVSNLARGHCGYDMDLDYGALIREAEQVRLLQWEPRSVKWERFSNRQRQRVPMSGFQGEAVYGGAIGPFLGLLLLGSLVHVGDNCTYGMGRFILGTESADANAWLPAGWSFEAERTTPEDPHAADA